MPLSGESLPLLQTTGDLNKLTLQRRRIVGLIPTAHYLAGKPLKDGSKSCVSLGNLVTRFKTTQRQKCNALHHPERRRFCLNSCAVHSTHMDPYHRCDDIRTSSESLQKLD